MSDDRYEEQAAEDLGHDHNETEGVEVPAPGRNLDVHPELLERRELLDGGGLLYVPGFFDGATADTLFQELREEIPWQNIRIRGVPQRLGTYWIGPIPYAYSGQVRPAAPWLPTVQAIRTAVESLVFRGKDTTYEGVLLNYYQNGDVKLGYHADDEDILVPEAPIASVSLGAPRRFVLRHNRTKAKHELTLDHGSLLVMQGTTQWYWQHAVPPEKNAGPRVNLTFRRLRTQSPTP
ncbi:MAG: alpha-ketoglutarate-dependent dioxygenase AlkB [Deltaproteobacteria bacterium]|nr:alpha-ketoglutarate-dependent dioxygenase AlkB [Myxococcales bacterium]MDP3217069.1 alpha-ketoglutarate-dependent dioxygenase AlkB [Deltaproteobacteria bacterium]